MTAPVTARKRTAAGRTARSRTPRQRTKARRLAEAARTRRQRGSWRRDVDTVTCIDLFELCAKLPAQSVDMILADLPYGVSQSKWDVMIPFAPMWAAFKRVIKPRGVIALTATQPFSSMLVMSNPEMFRYEWVWNKRSPVGHLNAHQRPMPVHEVVLVFSHGGETYCPQLRDEVSTPFGAVNAPKSGVYGETGNDRQFGIGYPLSILEFARPNNLSGGNLHPNQKPQSLMEYLIRTYTREGDIVLDPTCGSGTTAIAAKRAGRRFVCGDTDAGYVAVARKRLRDTDPYQSTEVAEGVVQHSLFAA